MRYSVKLIAEIGVMVALSAVLGLFVVYRPPQGGAVTAAMLPLFMLALRRGPAVGIMAGILGGTFQMLIDPYFVHPVQILVDYQLAWGSIGVAGFVKTIPYLAVVLGTFARFIFHCLSGFVFFSQYAPEGSRAGLGLLLYVTGYNAAYLVPSAIIALIVVLMIQKANWFRTI